MLQSSPPIHIYFNFKNKDIRMTPLSLSNSCRSHSYFKFYPFFPNFLSLSTENMRKSKVFWCFQRGSRGILEKKWTVFPASGVFFLAWSVLILIPQVKMSSFKWRVTVSGELMFLESYGNCDVTNAATLLWWRHKTIPHCDFW